ncbi:unnamed protein product [Arabis nemorensis]|uniref:ADP-ribosyl cyclase/cyclic ADP-ribose hydrolase n=1 Tax=Arabis nemorensis TaxID=586526 RepID=A0A565C374_9BRAS|nr:unnamed protein product [Arabis nemorensis]
METAEKTPLQHPRVFLSFRGAEMRQSFVSHLEMALQRDGVNLYVDQELMRGESMKSLFMGIEESMIALVIFSKRYTESFWCLEELVKIKERAEEGKLIVIPIYYKLNPSDVRELDGDFGINLWNHVKRTSEFDKLSKWKEALHFVSDRNGLTFTQDRDESAFIVDIVKFVKIVIYHLLWDVKSDVYPKEADSVQTEVKFQGILRKDDGLNLIKDDEFLGEANSDATSKLQDSAEINKVDPFSEEKQGNVSESSTMATYPPQHQVFINFRGAELRHGFVSHLTGALKRNGVNVYVEANELKGSDLSSLFNRIEESNIALVVFSSRYTESRWCLDELLKIKELRDEGKLLVIPIFYKVEQSHVTNLKGEFGDNFWTLWRINRDNHIIKWKEALKSVASNMGIYLEDGSESKGISFIVNEVKKVLEIFSQREGENPSLFPSTEKGKSTELPTRKGEKHETYLNKSHLFGMEQRMEQLEKKLEFDCNDTRIIGVVGIPGIGKTTLAMMLHEKWNRKFTRCVPLLGIHENSKENGLVWLQKTLLELLLEVKFPVISDKITHQSVKVDLLKTKFFAVLTDVSDKKQLQFLLGDLDWIKKGSKIIITTCDRSLLDGFARDTYVVPKLNGREAFQLFSSHAFSGQICSPTSTFLTLSRKFVDYAQGHPLALKLLGTELYGRDEAYWKCKLEMVTKTSNKTLQEVWRFSTELNEKQKDVFVDIECFFKSEDEYFVRSLLDSGDPDSIDAVSEVKDLANKFLITITDGRVEMNVPLCTFSKNLGSRQWLRLCNYEDIIHKLKKMQKSGANKVRGIFLDTSKLTESMCLDNSTFINMHNLRYLKIYDSCCPRQCKADCNLYFPDGIELPLEEIRYLHWVEFPLEELPLDFKPENLVDLRLPYSKIERVWEGVKDTPRLKWVDLSYSAELIDLSALSQAKSLKRLNLEGCTNLEDLPKEMENMKSLAFLNLRGCTSLLYFPENMNLISLKTLILSDCSNFEDFHVISESIEFLHLDGTSIKGLPLSIQNLRRLVVLNLRNCKMFECLPNCLGNLKALDKLILSGCSKLKNFLDVRNSLEHLQILLLDGIGAKEMPSISCFTGSEGPASVDKFTQPLGSHCSVREWPCGVNGVFSLRRLCLSGNTFVSLQPDIENLYNLKWLEVKQCKKLRSIPTLPPRLQYFDADGCDSLERVANPLAFRVSSDQNHATFNFSNCNMLDQDAKDNIISYTRWRSQLVLDELARYNGGLVLEALIGTCFPGWEVPAWFSYRASGSVLKPKLPPHWYDKKFTGIALCAVIVFDGYHNQRKRVLVKGNCEFKNEDGFRIRCSCTVGGWSEPRNIPRKIESSHVFIGFPSRLDVNKISEDDDDGEKCVCTETSIEFQVTDGTEEIKNCEVVKCGFSLVYALEERGNIY